LFPDLLSIFNFEDPTFTRPSVPGKGAFPEILFSDPNPELVGSIVDPRSTAPMPNCFFVPFFPLERLENTPPVMRFFYSPHVTSSDASLVNYSGRRTPQLDRPLQILVQQGNQWAWFEGFSPPPSPARLPPSCGPCFDLLLCFGWRINTGEHVFSAG